MSLIKDKDARHDIKGLVRITDRSNRDIDKLFIEFDKLSEKYSRLIKHLNLEEHWVPTQTIDGHYEYKKVSK